MRQDNRRVAAVRWWAFVALALLGIVGPASRLFADEQQEPPLALYEREPFDRITLKDKKVIEVQPLDLPGRKLPDNPKPADKLVVRLLDKPDDAYELRWRDVVEIKLFEQLILEEGQRLTAEKKFDEAFAYFDYLDRNYANYPGVAEAIEQHLYEDAKSWQSRQKYDYALALLNEIWNRNRSFPGLDRALGAASDKLIEAEIERGEYRAARRLLAALANKFPDEKTVARWQNELQSRAERLLAQARAEAEAGRIRPAQEQARQALSYWPRLEAARTLVAELHARYAVVAVGVAQPALQFGVGRLDDWAARRSGRLLAQTLVEFNGLGTEGGEYRSAFGELETTELGLQLTLSLRPGLHWPQGGAPVTAFDVSRTVLGLADPEDRRYDPDWAGILASVAVRDVYGVDIRLRRLHVRPAGFLQVPLEPAVATGAPAASVPALGPYRLGERTAAQTPFLVNDAYLAPAAQMPREIVERRFAKSSQAIEAFERGEIGLCDRLNPWDLDKLKNVPDLVVERYAVPTVHCLLANTNKPLLANHLFRRALLYGIHREAILKRQLLRDRAVPGCQVVSGPFPTGYAYNTEVEPRPYDPRLAMLLASVALAELRKAGTLPPAATAPATAAPAPATASGSPPADAAAEGEGKLPPGETLPTLVLAHPADEVARLACRSIGRQLALLKMPVKLVELPPGAVADPSGDYDLVYAELQLWEPVIDARRLLGPSGLAASTSPYLQAALAGLADAGDWKEARDRLLDIHRLAADEVSVIPLWQLSEHCAYRRGIKGIGQRPATLYQNVENWQISPYLPAEEQ